MRYAKIVFDTKELMQDAPRKELAAAGAACETGPAREEALFVSADPEAVDAAFAAGFPCALYLVAPFSQYTSAPTPSALHATDNASVSAIL